MASPWDVTFVVTRVETTGSTNADLVAAARAGAAHGSVLVADHQSAGRGRLDRRWEAPPGANLLCSILLREVEDPHVAVRRVSVAAAQTGGDHVRLKWPNDLVVGEAKVAGVLAELVEPGVVVVGIGVNLGWAPEGAAKLGVPRDAFLDQFLARLAAGSDDAAYRARLSTIGRAVRVELPDGTSHEGVATDVDPAGRLVLDDGRVVDVGDIVHLRHR
jgi:BirA family transcriptional regulator, biotin operon repressor / biotin---[acetyl-CoA-carboxylase] ligase